MPLSPLTEVATRALRKFAEQPADAQTRNAALRFLAKWRAELVANTLLHRSGFAVLTGPFAGMDHALAASKGSASARLPGCCEASLPPVIEEIIARAYPVVIDSCLRYFSAIASSAEQDCAVGLARRMPQSRIVARGASDTVLALCRALAAASGVADRVEVGGSFRPADFAICAGQATLVLCDIEGAGTNLLDPAAAPGLMHADILVECHDAIRPGITQTLADRFAPSHHVQRIDRALALTALPGWF